jgi:branched-chain amino acid transport system ATP-binding protein
MLEIININAYYGGIHALKDVTLKVNGGDLVTIIGANGAGKTTLLRSLSGLINSKTGRIIYDSKDITKLSPIEIVKLGICQVLEGRQIFSHLKVIDNLRLGAYLYNRKRYRKEIEKRLEDILDTFPILKEREKQIAGTLSGGEQQMLAIGRALMSGPRLLLLDEPSLGLAPLVVHESFRVIKELNSRGTTILLVEQNARAALRIATYGYVLEIGELKLEGKSEDLLNDKKVKSAYLGG